MDIGRVLGNVVLTRKHAAYNGKKILMVQPLRLDGTPRGTPIVAADYVGAGVGDIVMTGSAPGVAKKVFGLDLAPLRTLIMAVVDAVHETEDGGRSKALVERGVWVGK